MSLKNPFIVIIDLGIGNLLSVKNALEHKSNIKCVISNNINDIINCQAIILPGVGAFNLAIEKIIKDDIFTILKDEVLNKQKPILGICLGMQLLFESSLENGYQKGLAFLKGKVIRLPDTLQVPHVGWNNLITREEKNIFLNLKHNNTDVYFDHTYHVLCNEDIVSSTCQYQDTEIITSVTKNNIWGVQFHPEKSQAVGLNILKNFIKYVEKY